MVRADPSLLGESKALLLWQRSFLSDLRHLILGFLCLISQVFLWMHHLRDWIWERLRLWRIFKGLQTNSTDWFKQQLRYLNPRCGPLTSHTTLTIKFDFLSFQTLTGKPSHAAIIITFKLWRVGTIPSFLDPQSDGNSQRQTELDHPLKLPKFFQLLKRHWLAAFPSKFTRNTTTNVKILLLLYEICVDIQVRFVDFHWRG